MASKPRNPNQQANKTEKKWTAAEDARKTKEAGKYPDYWSFKSRSGHSMIFDDSKGEESVTFQHRGGSAIQMDKDGAIHITAHNSLYTIVFAENRMVVSGAQDITVKGDASLRVYGELNETVHGNYNLTVMGDYNITAKNQNRVIRGNMDTHAKNETKKFEGSSAVLAKGSIARVSAKGATLASQGGKAYVTGSSGVHVSSPMDGDVTVESKKGNIAVKAMKDISTESTSGNIGVKSESGKISVKGDTVGIDGKTTAHIKAMTVNVKGETATNAGADSSEMSDIFGQLFSMAKAKLGVTKAAMGQDEEDASGWTQGLL